MNAGDTQHIEECIKCKVRKYQDDYLKEKMHLVPASLALIERVSQCREENRALVALKQSLQDRHLNEERSARAIIESYNKNTKKNTDLYGNLDKTEYMDVSGLLLSHGCNVDSDISLLQSKITAITQSYQQLLPRKLEMGRISVDVFLKLTAYLAKAKFNQLLSLKRLIVARDIKMYISQLNTMFPGISEPC